MDIQAYLRRINYSGPVEPTLDTLRALHLSHVLAVPFENLDIPLGRRIMLDEARFFEKIVNQRRGGFCFELNGLFAALLESLGFRVRRLASRMWESGKGVSKNDFGHLTLMVALEEPWLADVSGSFNEPLRINARGEQVQGKDRYRIAEQEDQLVLLRQVEGAWQPNYLFKLQPYNLPDFAPACNYTQTSPESWFTQRRVCTRATPDGRITLKELNLTITQNGSKEERALSGESEFQNALWKYFGIRL